MTTIANSAILWQTFNYNFDDPNGRIQILSTDTQDHMNSMPAFVEPWQVIDIANRDFGGYYQNPIASVALSIKTSAQELANVGSNGVINLANTAAAAANLVNSAVEMLNHTNRLSGVTLFEGEDLVNPYLNMVLGSGRTLIYITNQTDGVINSAPIMGSMTSLLIEPQLSANSNTLITYESSVLNSIGPMANSTGHIITSSNLSNSMITTINTFITNLTNYMDYRRTSDVTFYTNVKAFISGYNETKKLTDLGETGKYLMNNLIGTEKAKTRLAQ